MIVRCAAPLTLFHSAHTLKQVNLPAIDRFEQLAKILRAALLYPHSPLGRCLRQAERHALRAFYLSPTPDTSDRRRVRFQHQALGCTKLYRELKARGYSRLDVRIGLEHIRYLSFIDSTNTWMNGGARSLSVPFPKPLTYDLRGRAHAQHAFAALAYHLRLPLNIPLHGTITPVTSPSLGFAFRVTSEGRSRTFLAALLDGTRLTSTIDSASATGKGIHSANRNLLNILTVKAPACLELACAPREIRDVGSYRVSLFCSSDRTSPPRDVYLPPSVGEGSVVPKVDGFALLKGQKRIQLVSTKTGQAISRLVVELGDKPSVEVQLPPSVSPSPFKRFEPLAAYLRGRSDTPTPPLLTSVHRSTKSSRHVHQRIIIGNQMVVPAWYPLGEIEIHPLQSSDSTRYIGLYPLGVSPVTNPPIKAFTLNPTEAKWVPVDPNLMWTPPTKSADHLRSLICAVLDGQPAISRDAWVQLYRFSLSDPLLAYALLFTKSNNHSLSKEPLLSRAHELAGWSGFKANLEDSILKEQARSVPYVAHLIAEARQRAPIEVKTLLAHLVDSSWPPVTDPLRHLTRLATVSRPELEAAVRAIQSSPRPAFAALAGSTSALDVIVSLGRSAPRGRPGNAPRV